MCTLCRTARRARHHAWQGSSDRPILHNRLGLIIPIAPDIDIDALGTFTGAVLSAGTIREMTNAKARLNMRPQACRSALPAKAATWSGPCVSMGGAVCLRVAGADRPRQRKHAPSQREHQFAAPQPPVRPAVEAFQDRAGPTVRSPGGSSEAAARSPRTPRRPTSRPSSSLVDRMNDAGGSASDKIRSRRMQPYRRDRLTPYGRRQRLHLEYSLRAPATRGARLRTEMCPTGLPLRPPRWRQDPW